MDITIKYNHGTMVIHLDEFLNCRNITKFKKLLKLMSESHNQDVINLVKSHIQLTINRQEYDCMVTRCKVLELEPLFAEHEKTLNLWIKYRNRMKKNTNTWKEYNREVIQARHRFQQVKKSLRTAKKDLDTLAKNIQFYKKCLQLIS